MALFRPKRRYVGIQIPPPAQVGAYTITATSGTYNITGNATGLKVGYKLSATSGSYTITGNAQALSKGYPLTATSGTYAITGNDVSFRRGYVLTATAGTYAITGNDVTLTKSAGATLVAVSGSYAITGNAVNLLWGRALSATSGSYAITGNAVTLNKGATMATVSGTYAITGNAVSFTRTYVLAVDNGLYAITGSAVALNFSGASSPFRGDIGPGDYSKTSREYKTRHELIPKKRKRLTKAVVKQITKVARTAPSSEDLQRLAKTVLPSSDEHEADALIANIFQAIENNVAQAAIAEMEAANQREQAMQYRRQLIIEEIAKYLDIMEQDEILLAYLL